MTAASQPEVDAADGNLLTSLGARTAEGGADRTQAIAALDGAAPAWMGRFASFGTPIAVNLSSRVIASVICVLVFVLAKGSLASFFAVMLALTVSTTVLSYLFIFPALVVLRRKYPRVGRPYRVPGGQAGAWLAVIITEAFVVVTVITLLWPGALNALFGQPYSIESSWGASRVFFESVRLGSLAVMIALGLAFWALGERKRRAGLLGIAVMVPGPRGSEPPPSDAAAAGETPAAPAGAGPAVRPGEEASSRQPGRRVWPGRHSWGGRRQGAAGR